MLSNIKQVLQNRFDVSIQAHTLNTEYSRFSTNKKTICERLKSFEKATAIAAILRCQAFKTLYFL